MTCNLYINKQHIGEVTGIKSEFTPWFQCGNRPLIYNINDIRCNIINRCITQYRNDDIILDETKALNKLVYIQIKDENDLELLCGYFVITGIKFNAEYEGKITDIITCVGVDD